MENTAINPLEFKRNTRENYRDWSVTDILRLSKDLQSPGSAIETPSLNPQVISKIKIESLEEKVKISFTVNADAHIFDTIKNHELKSHSDLPVETIGGKTRHITISKGPEIAITEITSGELVQIIMDKKFAYTDIESLGINKFFAKDSIPSALGHQEFDWSFSEKSTKTLIKESAEQGSFHFAGRPDISVKLVRGYDDIEKAIPPPKPGMQRLYKGTNVEWAVKMMREGIFSTPIQPNLSEEITGEVKVAVDGYKVKYGDKQYSVFLVIDCMPDEYENQGGYEDFGVAKKEYTGNTERFGFLNQHTRHIPPERITECIFVEHEPKKED